MNRPLRCWTERAHGVCPQHPALAERLAEPESERTPLRTVTMPTNGLSMTPDELIGIILAQVEDNDVDLIVEPSPELVAAWKRYKAEPDAGHRWQAWGPLCLVCHRDVPEGDAVSYPFVLGSRACIGGCAAHVDSLLRIYDRSARGRWRPVRDVHTLANGSCCDECMEAVR